MGHTWRCHMGTVTTFQSTGLSHTPLTILEARNCGLAVCPGRKKSDMIDIGRTLTIYFDGSLNCESIFPT